MFDITLAMVILGLAAAIVLRLDRVEMVQASGVVTINDGDTVTLDGRRIRLRGIDAPEWDQSCKRAGETYLCGRAAKQALRDLIADRPVTCEGWEHDRYKRLLATCQVGGTNLNRSLVTEGWAVSFGDFEAEEKDARDASRGLWAGTFERPSTWRHAHGALVESNHDALAAFVNALRAILGL